MREPVDVSVGGALVVEEIAPAGEATTDSSVVGNWPVVPFAFTAGVPGAVVALETTELSVVGNACGTLALGRGVGRGADATERVSSLCGN